MVLERPSWTLRRPRRAGVGRLFASRRWASALAGVLIALRAGLASPGDPSSCVCPAPDSSVAAQPDAPESSHDDSRHRGQPPPRAATCCRPWGFSPLRRFGLRVRFGCLAIQPDGVRTVSGSRRPSLAALVADHEGRVPVPAPKNRRGGRLDAVPGALTPFEESHTRETGPITGDPHRASDRTRVRRCRRVTRALFFHGFLPLRDQRPARPLDVPMPSGPLHLAMVDAALSRDSPWHARGPHHGVGRRILCVSRRAGLAPFAGSRRPSRSPGGPGSVGTPSVRRALLAFVLRRSRAISLGFLTSKNVVTTFR